MVLSDEMEMGTDIVTVVDESGEQHKFEVLDAIETDRRRYVALLPIFDEASSMVNDDGELVILAVEEEDGEDMLVPIEDDGEFDEVAEIFEERLADLFEIEDMEGIPEE